MATWRSRFRGTARGASSRSWCRRTRFDGFDGRSVSLYARGMTVREIQGHLQDLYGVEVSPDLISRVTDAVLEEVREWQNRPLDPVYPVIFFDALRVKIRDDGLVRNKAVYVALALDVDGEKHVLGLWIEQSEGAKFWLKVMNELKTRGERHPDRRRRRPARLPGAISAVFPEMSGGRHDNYGSALAAQPGGSRRRSATNTSARLIVRIGLPAPSCSRCLCPGWSHHTPRSRRPRPNLGTEIFIPVPNAVESLHRSFARSSGPAAASRPTRRPSSCSAWPSGT